nr:PREDICTED: vimentin-1/2-like [Latimeria chalumnae]|eukprot:XP_014341758.1 PREDICTED: vimentin-1/2-like [Latimeria chalumnae]
MSSFSCVPETSSLSGVTNRYSERAQLQELSERFSNYITNVKSMRDHLTKWDFSAQAHQIRQLEEEVVAIHSLYDKEIQALREQLDLSSRDRLRAEVSSHKNSQMAAEYQDRIILLNMDMLKKDEELKKLQLLLAQKDTELQEIKTSAVSPSVQLDVVKRELEELQKYNLEIQKK